MAKDKTDGLLQIRYVKSSDIGLVIEDLKKSEINVSQIVRNFLMCIKGYQVLKQRGLSQNELKAICVNNLQFFAAQYEISKMNLQEQHNTHIDENNILSFEDKLIAKSRFKTKKEKKNIEQDSVEELATNDLSFINSLLPN